MSFGYEVGDVIAVGKLAWDLYNDCFLVARGAPQEFRLLVDELKTVEAMMRMLGEELQRPDSVLARSGRDRQKMVQDLVLRTKEILVNLQSTFTKHRKLGNASRRSAFKRGWDQMKWSLDAKDVDALRNKALSPPRF